MIEHIYSPIRQTQTEKYRYIQRDTKLNITKHVVIELTQQIALCNGIKTVLIALITVKNHERPLQNTSCSKPDLRYRRL